MTDVMTRDQRSAAMSAIRAKNTTPELRVRKALWRRRFRFRLHVRGLPGRPDVVLPKWNCVVFVNGCFWHAHDACPAFRLPSTRPEYWRAKIGANRERDSRSYRALTEAGWRIAVIWECAVRVDCEATVDALSSWLTGTEDQRLEVARDWQG